MANSRQRIIDATLTTLSSRASPRPAPGDRRQRGFQVGADLLLLPDPERSPDRRARARERRAPRALRRRGRGGGDALGAAGAARAHLRRRPRERLRARRLGDGRRQRREPRARAAHGRPHRAVDRRRADGRGSCQSCVHAATQASPLQRQLYSLLSRSLAMCFCPTVRTVSDEERDQRAPEKDPVSGTAARSDHAKNR